jgi:DNA-binding MarR family transcriptional regulator
MGFEEAQRGISIELGLAERRLFPRKGYEGLDTTALQVLLALCVSESTAGEGIEPLAARLVLDPSTVSHAVRRLAEDELVRPGAGQSDGKRRSLVPTARGRRLAGTFARTSSRPSRS